MLALALLLGCQDAAPPETPVCEAGGETRIAAVSAMRFARQVDGVSQGFNLDGHETDAGDDEGCGVQDYTNENGETGIDNGFATLVPILELTEAGAIEPLIADAIASGELLFLAQMKGLDDPRNDDCVDFTFFRGAGDPDLGPDGRLLGGQTFDLETDVEPIHFPGLPLHDGMVDARPFVTRVPITILNAELEFELQDAAIHAELGADGQMRGYFGGALDTETLVTLAAERSSDPNLVGTIRDLLALAADLNPDESGVCQKIAINFEFEAVSAFLYADVEL